MSNVLMCAMMSVHHSAHGFPNSNGNARQAMGLISPCSVSILPLDSTRTHSRYRHIDRGQYDKFCLPDSILANQQQGPPVAMCAEGTKKKW